METNTLVYVIDSDDTISTALGTVLRPYDIAVHAFTDAESFRAALSTAVVPQCCALIGLEPPGSGSIPLLTLLRQDGYRFPVIIMTSEDGDLFRELAVTAGATDLVEKALIYPYLFSRLNSLLPGSASLPATAPATVKLRDGTLMTARMIEPADADMHQIFVTGLSDRSRYLRFFSGIKSLSPYILRELTSPDFPHSHAIIGTIGLDGIETEIGVARYAPTGKPGVAEFAVVVADDWQGLGIASHLLRGIILSATIAGFELLEGVVLSENRDMLTLAKNMGFHTVVNTGLDDKTVVHVAKALLPAADQR
jgi:CheY-like chemotaxis protein/GNAT superfamily N-acetyltransferase